MSLTRVLVVDDSAFVRKTLGAILGRSPSLEVVGFAGDGREALEQVERLRPDVVTVDLEMPILNGVGFIEAQMERAPLPIIVVSSVDRAGTLAGESMRAGAVEFVLKPTHLADKKLAQIEEELLRKVHMVAGISSRQLLLERLVPPPVLLPKREHPRPTAIVIGVSTGGPQLLHQFLPRLPSDYPIPLAVVIHMPVGFTGPLADRLDKAGELEIREARLGLAMRPGRCIIGKAGHHILLSANGTAGVQSRFMAPKLDDLYKPSVDELFRSAAESYGAGLLALVLTGMGQDGLAGAAWIKAAGGRVYTQSKESCVVWGMPRSVKESGLSDGDVEASDLATFLLQIAQP